MQHDSKPQPSHPGFDPGHANFALATFLIAYVLSFVDRQILSLMVDPIRRDLGLTDIQIGLIQGLAFALLYATMGLPFGMWVDRYSRKRIIASGIAFWSIATALCGTAGSYTHLFLARIGVGVGEATLSPAAHSYLSDAFPPHRLARAMAIYTLGITIGGGGALIIGGAVVDMVAQSGGVTLPMLGELKGWQTAFLIVAAPGLPVAALVLLVREPARGKAGDASSRSADGAGLPEIIGFLRQHWRAFLSIHAASCLMGICGYAMLGWYPTLLMRHFGLSAGQAGLWLGLIYLLIGSFGSLAGGLLAERLALKGRADANLRAVVILAGATLIPATVAPVMPTAWLVFLCFAPACFFFSGYFGCAVAAIQLASPPSMRGANSALFLLSNSMIGLSLGMVAVPAADKILSSETSGLGLALALISGATCLSAAVAARLGLRHYAAIAAR